MDKAVFKLDSYHFSNVELNFNFNIPSKAELCIDFKPCGVFKSEESLYDLTFDVTVEYQKIETNVVKISCKSRFLFDKKISFEEIPEFFYPNSLAIIFPYIRAFVSTVSLQANVQPIILPTINLMGLTEQLKNNTKVQ